MDKWHYYLMFKFTGGFGFNEAPPDAVPPMVISLPGDAFPLESITKTNTFEPFGKEPWLKYAVMDDADHAVGINGSRWVEALNVDAFPIITRAQVSSI